MRIDPRRHPERAWEALTTGPEPGLLAAIVEHAGELADKDQHGLVLAALALAPPKRFKPRVVFAELERGEEAEEALLAIWEKGGHPASLLLLAGLRFGWMLPPACRDLLLAEMDVLEADDDDAVALLVTALTAGVAAAPDLMLSGAPICTEALAAAMALLPDTTRRDALSGYAALLCRDEALEALPEPADVHGLLIHDLLSTPEVGDTLLELVGARLKLAPAQAAARLLLATMRTAIDPHASADYVARRAQGGGELVDAAMMRGFFELKALDYRDTGLDRWAVVLRYEDEVGAQQQATITFALTERDLIAEWVEPIPTPTDPAWWPDLLHRNLQTPPAFYAINPQGRLVLRAQPLREGFELRHFEAIWAAFEVAIRDLQDL